MLKAIAVLFLGLSCNAYACKLPYIEYEPVFEVGKSVLSGSEVKRLAFWRSDTRRAFPAGFRVDIVVWQNSYAGISASLAQDRSEHLRTLLRDLGVPQDDIVEVEIRRNTMRLSKLGADALFNRAELHLAPRCPHACCDLGDLR